MAVPSSSSFESLLSHASFLRSLARELSRDSNRADDLVQRTWVAALEHPPSDDKPLRRWLAAILRNFAREEHRTETRRTSREALAARPIATSEPEVLAEQIALQHSLLRAVSELDEPYRSVIYQRYYEGLAPQEIAARSGVPLKTIKTHLHRGLAKLRARLDREHRGDRLAWLRVLIPLTGAPSWTVHTLGALLLDAKLKVTLACVALIGAVGGVVFVSSREAAPIAEATIPQALEEPKDRALAPVEERARRRFETAASAAPATTFVATPEATRKIRGRVFDLQRRPVGGIELVEHSDSVPVGAQGRSYDQEAAPVIATSAADGTFELAAPPRVLVLLARSPRFVTVLAARVAQNFSAADPIVAVAPRRALAGVVLDPEGKPVVGAQVEIVLPKNVRSGMGEILDHSFLMSWKTATDEQGHFELADAPGCTGELCASSPAFEKASIELPSQPTYDIVLRLGSTKTPQLVVRGLVVDEHGAPVDQAYVALGKQTVLSAADGSFELEADIDPDSMPMVLTPAGYWDFAIDLRAVRAVKAGFLPAIHALPELDELRAHPLREPIVLQLGGEPLSIAGRVEDMEGNPVAGVAVWPVDGSSFGHVTSKVGREGHSVPVSIEEMVRGPQADQARSNANGRFVLGGLCDREYELAAFDAATMRSARIEHVRSGLRGVVIQLRAQKDLVRIGGRVVTESGAPVPAVRVSAAMNFTGAFSPSFGPSVTTDDQGRFGFLGEAAPGLYFLCSSESILPVLAYQPEPEQRLDELEIVVWLRCHLQVDLGVRKNFADNFAALDATGKPTTILVFRGPTMSSGERHRFNDGKSEIVVVRDSCRTIVIYDDRGEELGRLPVSLKPGELNVVTW